MGKGLFTDDNRANPLCWASRLGGALIEGFTFMPFPCWHNSLSFMVIGAMTTQLPYAPTMARFTGGVRVLPDVPDVASVEQLASNTTYIGTSGTYTMYRSAARACGSTDDYSGSRTETMNLQQPQYDQPENARLTATNTSLRGVIHPRAYLFLFYRADSLRKLRSVSGIGGGADAGVAGAAGAASSEPQPPADWEEMIELLAAHRAAVDRARESLHATVERAGAVLSYDIDNAVAAAAAGLPEHGLCLSAHTPSCSRLGDLLAAIAASIVQTTGTTQVRSVCTRWDSTTGTADTGRADVTLPGHLTL
ncbi:hypothetical protein HXX76_013154 [Chlamydomonas incerta]|uniref:Uncharacterized protein n=1 Tax=Chlamydomonas incerta TaxID=51695 RepID=A0A835SFB4_CHLIN|nr:hypothetical protein HXX76_013154 [Chlamydomonas incerta]|eukprot:KAG2426173.1 hypothetical protein HXX76_013154 [Chlamydomonas incerta]